jgi:hypothetical protein
VQKRKGGQDCAGTSRHEELLRKLAIRHTQARLIETPVPNSTFDRGSLSLTYVKPFDVFAKGSETGDWLTTLDDFRNYLIRAA